MPTGVVLFDTIGYRTAAGDALYADQGETVDLDQEQYDRHLELGSIEPAGKTKASEPAQPPVPPAGDEFDQLSYAELKERAKAAGIEKPANKKAADLRDELRALAAASEPQPPAGPEPVPPAGDEPAPDATPPQE